jgi:hypothetical protein
VIYLTLLEALAVTEGRYTGTSARTRGKAEQFADPTPISVCLYVVSD